MARKVFYVCCAVSGAKAFGGYLKAENGGVLDQQVFDYSGIGCDINECNLRVLRTILKQNNFKLDIVFDSDFMVEVFKNNYIKKWEYNGWKTLKDKEVSNKDLWVEIGALIKGKDIRVKSTSKNKGDELYKTVHTLVMNRFE